MNQEVPGSTLTFAMNSLCGLRQATISEFMLHTCNMKIIVLIIILIQGCVRIIEITGM